MKELSKIQKFIIAITILWEIFVLLDCFDYYYYSYNSFLSNFVEDSLFPILYWLGVFVWGSRYIKRFFYSLFVGIPKAIYKYFAN